jgi:inositol 1,4,5-triphosphate receptor type 2
MFNVLAQHVLLSLSANGRQLAFTAAFVVILVYIYAIFAFNFFRDMFTVNVREVVRLMTLPAACGGVDVLEWCCQPQEYPNNNEYTCESLYQCFFFILNNGLRNGGGVGDTIEQPSFHTERGVYFGRLVFDLSFFVGIVLFLLNGGECCFPLHSLLLSYLRLFHVYSKCIAFVTLAMAPSLPPVVLGLIIDTFARLRSAEKETADEMRSYCFICHIERQEFDKARGFKDHIANDHFVS